MKLRNKILSDPVTRWVFEHSGNNAFLVGGYVRDLITGRKSADRDFVMGGDIDKFALDLVSKFEGRVINISRYNIRRVILKKREFIDITPLGRNIKSNLQKRDFTINAIAWSPENGFIDPLNGVIDINSKVIRITNSRSLSDDPLRCIRAFRIAAELDFNIDRDTLLECEKHSRALPRVTEERKTDEMIKFLNNNDVAKYLELSCRHNVLCEVIGLNQLDIINNIDTIKSIDNYLERVRLKHFTTYKSLNLKGLLTNEISQGMKVHSLIRLAILSYGDKNDEIHIKGLKLSNEVARRLKLIQSAIRDSLGTITKHRLYGILRLADECSEEVALILSAMKRDFSMEYLNMAQDLKRFINEDRVDGNDIQRELNLDEGMRIGQIKEEIYRKWFLGELKTRQDIISFVRSNLT